MGCCATKQKSKQPQIIKANSNIKTSPPNLSQHTQRKPSQPYQNHHQIHKNPKPKPDPVQYQSSPQSSSKFQKKLKMQNKPHQTIEIQDQIQEAKFMALQEYFSILQQQVILSINPMTEKVFASYLKKQRKNCINKFKAIIQQSLQGKQTPESLIQQAIISINQTCTLSDDYYSFYNNLHSFQDANQLKKQLVQSGLLKQSVKPKHLIKQYEQRAVGSYIEQVKEDLIELISEFQNTTKNRRTVVRSLMMKQTMRQRELMKSQSEIADKARRTMTMAVPSSKVLQKLPQVVNKKQSFGIREIDNSFLRQTHTIEENFKQEQENPPLGVSDIQIEECVSLQAQENSAKPNFEQKKELKIQQAKKQRLSVSRKEMALQTTISIGGYANNQINSSPIGQFPPPPPPIGNFPPPPPPIGQFPPPPPPIGNFPPPPPPIGQFPPPPPPMGNFPPAPHSNPLRATPLNQNRPQPLKQINESPQNKKPTQPSPQDKLMQQLRLRLKRRTQTPVDANQHLKSEMKKRYQEIHTPAVRLDTPLMESKHKKHSSSSSHYSNNQ